MRLWIASFVVLVSSVASAQTSPTYTQRGALERATRHQPRDDEHNDRDPEQGGRDQQEPSDEVIAHELLLCRFLFCTGRAARVGPWLMLFRIRNRRCCHKWPASETHIQPGLAIVLSTLGRPLV